MFRKSACRLRPDKSKFTLQTLPAGDFPKISSAAAAGAARATLPQNQLKRLFALVQYAMAQQDIRYYLNGLLLSLQPEGITVVATDGHRLAFAGLQLPLDTPATEVILPRKAIVELSQAARPIPTSRFR